MKKTMLWSALFTLIGTQVHAELTQPVTPPPQSSGPTSNPAPSANPTTALEPTKAVPATQNIPSAHPVQPAAATINCDYKIPAETKKIDPALVLSWTEKAVTQAFDFDPNSLDAQMQKLQPCFTEQGWTGFNTALQKSGNLEAIKSQKLTVSSQVEGATSATETKDNIWKFTIPLQVVYQNDKEKVTQLLSVDVTVSRKITGDLGITQMIAAPRGSVTTQKPSAPKTDINGNPINNNVAAPAAAQPALPSGAPAMQQTPPPATTAPAATPQ